MAVKVAINGFGRIGRLVLRAMIESNRTDVECVAINDLGSVEANAHLFRYDSVHGRFPGEVQVEGDSLVITCNGRRYAPIKVTAERDPTKLPWQGVDVAAECTGIFTSSDKAALLLKAGPRKVLHDKFGILRGYMVTIHAYTGDQNTVDTLHKDLHRARAAAVSAIPTSTGAAKAVGLVLPELKGKLDGTAIRIPTPNVSIVSLDVNLKAEGLTKEQVNAAMKEASEGALKGILFYNTEPLVSVDFNHNAASCTFDATQTQSIDGGRMIRVMGWYDNEWGFSNRMSDTAALMGRLG